MPQRIQLRRTKGWRKPAGAVVVARPSLWGNPFVGDRAVEAYREYVRVVILGERGNYLLHDDGVTIGGKWFQVEIAFRHSWDDVERLRKELPDLRGKDLCCWCPLDRDCHASVLLEIANR